MGTMPFLSLVEIQDKSSNQQVFKVMNIFGEKIGDIKFLAVGNTYQWCFIPDDSELKENYYLTNRYLREISNYLWALNKKTKREEGQGGNE